MWTDLENNVGYVNMQWTTKHPSFCDFSVTDRIYTPCPINFVARDAGQDPEGGAWQTSPQFQAEELATLDYLQLS